MISQCDKILRHIQDNGSITTWDAFVEYGVTRLASRIWDLNQRGYEFNKKFETTKNRYGESVSYVRYSFK